MDIEFAGDGILILFNDPIPYPDHTQRAVRMAVEMRDNVGKLSENWRSRVNLASRLCDEAKAGQILISQRAFVLVEPLVNAAPVGALNLKGFNRPIPAFEILAWRDESQCQGLASAPASAANDN